MEVDDLNKRKRVAQQKHRAHRRKIEERARLTRGSSPSGSAARSRSSEPERMAPLTPTIAKPPAPKRPRTTTPKPAAAPAPAAEPARPARAAAPKRTAAPKAAETEQAKPAGEEKAGEE